MNISITGVQLIDLALRFAAIGQLCLLFGYLLKQHKAQAPEKLALCSCIIAYIALTAPIENHHYGFSRNILLLITDLTPMVALWYTAKQLDPKFSLSKLPKSLLTASFLWLMALAVLFIGFQGQHFLHDLNHGLGIAILLAVVYLCMRDYLDDLDNQRRQARIRSVALCSLYMSSLVLFEFLDRNIRNSWQFSLANALCMFTLIQVVCSLVLFKVTTPVKSNTKRNNKQQAQETDQRHLESLKQTMNQGAFLQTELSIGKLAEQIQLPAHQLRRLINQELGFNNFSQYLNSYRIPWVCEQLRRPDNTLPVLSIALEAGYGSIAPFNRAFKSQMGVTPKQYRDQF